MNKTLKLLWGVILFEICALLTVSALIWQRIIPFESFLPDQTAHMLFSVLAGVSTLILIAQQVFLRKRPDLKMAAPDQLEALKKKYFIFHKKRGCKRKIV